MNDVSNNTMSRAGAIARAERYFDSGALKADLARRVAIPSESQNPERAAELRHYIEAEMRPALEAMGFACRILTHLKARGPFCSPSGSRIPRAPPCSAMAMARRGGRFA
jgi:hypothetical protein